MNLGFAYTRLQPLTAIPGDCWPEERGAPVSVRHHPGVTLEALPCGSRNLLMLRYLRGYFGVGLVVHCRRRPLPSKAHNPSCHSMLRRMVAL